MSDKLDEVEAHKRIAEEAWHRGLHMRDTEVAELRAANERLQLRGDRFYAQLRDRTAMLNDASAENERLRAAMESVLKAHAEWERACEQDSDRADDAWYGLHEAIEHDLASALGNDKDP